MMLSLRLAFADEDDDGGEIRRILAHCHSNCHIVKLSVDKCFCLLENSARRKECYDYFLKFTVISQTAVLLTF